MKVKIDYYFENHFRLRLFSRTIQPCSLETFPWVRKVAPDTHSYVAIYIAVFHHKQVQEECNLAMTGDDALIHEKEILLTQYYLRILSIHTVLNHLSSEHGYTILFFFLNTEINVTNMAVKQQELNDRFLASHDRFARW